MAGEPLEGQFLGPAEGKELVGPSDAGEIREQISVGGIGFVHVGETFAIVPGDFGIDEIDPGIQGGKRGRSRQISRDVGRVNSRGFHDDRAAGKTGGAKRGQDLSFETGSPVLIVGRREGGQTASVEIHRVDAIGVLRDIDSDEHGVLDVRQRITTFQKLNGCDRDPGHA